MGSEEWRVEGGQRRVLGAGRRLMTRLHFLKHCTETDKMLCGSIK